MLYTARWRLDKGPIWYKRTIPQIRGTEEVRRIAELIIISIKLLRRFYLRFLYQKHAFIEAIAYRENQYWRKSKTWIENVIVNVVMDRISIESCLDASICSFLIKSMLSWKQSPTEKLTLKWPIWGKSQSCIEIWKYWAGTKGWLIKMCNKGVNI